MVKVKLTNDWFAPSDKFVPDKMRVFSGKRFRKGVVEVPEELVPFLPKGTVMLDKVKVYEAPAPEVQDFRELDLDRVAGDVVEKIKEDADKQLKSYKKK
jgi:hypothetical protein